MLGTEPHYKLLYQYAVLRARLEIREHYLKTIIREVYENIGQVLSLVRVQLSLFEPGTELIGKEKIDFSGKLVGSAIRDLRHMCQRLQPDTEILSGNGFYSALTGEIKILYPGATCFAQPDRVVLQTLENDRLLILFNILLETLLILKKDDGRQLLSMELNPIEQGLEFVFNYTGSFVQAGVFKLKRNKADLSIDKRVALLAGSLNTETGKHNKRKIKLVVSLN